MSNMAQIYEYDKGLMKDQSLDHIYGQPTTENIITMDNQMAKICAAVPLTSWGVKHVNLALALDQKTIKGPPKTSTQLSTKWICPQPSAPVLV